LASAGVADFIAFLKFQDKRPPDHLLDPSQLVSLATDFAEEDRYLLPKLESMIVR
jgi:hypothetical protein